MAKARLTTLEGRREVLDDLVRVELLAAAALKRGYAEDPRVQRLLNEALADVYLERELEPRRLAVEVPEAVVRARFEAEKERLSTPARVRVAQLFLAAPAEPAAQKTVRRGEAEALLSQAQRALAKDFDAFSALVRVHSEEPSSRSNGGELHPMTLAELGLVLGGEGANAAFAEQRVGALIPRVLESEAGFHLVRVLEHHAASEADYARARDALSARLKGEAQQRLYDAFLAELRAQMPVVVNEDVLREFHP